MRDKNGVEIQRGDIVTVSIRAAVADLYEWDGVSVRIPYASYALDGSKVEVDLSVRENQLPSPAISNSCNRHSDCKAADEKAKETGARFGASHCHDDTCEDCFGN